MIVRTVKGRLPMNSGEYVSSKVYNKKYRCNLYGCEWESLIEDNTFAPATIQGRKVIPDTVHWRLVSGVPDNYFLSDIAADIEDSVKGISEKTDTFEKNVENISNQFNGILENFKTIEKDVKDLKSEVGELPELSAVEDKINALKTALLGGVGTDYDTLKKLADVLSDIKGKVDRGEIGGTTIKAANGEHINEVGTPKIDVSNDGGTTTLTFNYLKGEKGEQGSPGQNGTNGVSPNLTIGSVSTGSAGSNAQASITGSFPDLKLNLTIPQGQKGETGSDGQSEDVRNAATYKTASGNINIEGAHVSLAVIECNGNITGLNFASMPPAGKDTTILFKNVGGGRLVTISPSSTLITPGGQDISLTIPTNGYVEVNAISDGTNLYVRGC